MFTLPLSDDNPTRRLPVVTWTVIAGCIAVFLWQSTLGVRAGNAIVYSLGLIPAVLFGSAQLPPELRLVPAPISILTSMFLHGGWMHLLGNMLYLWIFGNNVEDSMGRGRFIVFYLLCGMAAALVQSFTAPGSEVPMIGASGAIGGVLGAYLVLHPRANVRMLFVILFFIRVISVPAAVVLGLWFLSSSAGISGCSKDRTAGPSRSHRRRRREDAVAFRLREGAGNEKTCIFHTAS
jgi:membrane associated rhomboid family serine protease